MRLKFPPIHNLSIKNAPVLLEYGALAPTGEGDINDAACGLRYKQKADQFGVRSCCLKVAKSEQYTGYPGGKNSFVESVLNISPVCKR